MSKTSNNTNDDAAAKAAGQPGEMTQTSQPEKETTPAKASVRIKTTAKVTIGRIVCGPGVTVKVTSAQATSLEAIGKARILGV